MIYIFFLFPLSSTAVFRHTLHIHTTFSSSHARTPIYKYFILENNVIPSSAAISPMNVVMYRTAAAVTMYKTKMGKPKRFNVIFLKTITVFESKFWIFRSERQITVHCIRVDTYIGVETCKRIRILFFCPIFILYFIWLSIWTDVSAGKVCVRVGRRVIVVVVVVAIAVVVVIVVAREEPRWIQLLTALKIDECFLWQKSLTPDRPIFSPTHHLQTRFFPPYRC